MKNKGLITMTIIFFLLVNTSYYWEGKLGLFAMAALLILVIAFAILLIVLFRQIFLAFKEKFRDKSRILNLGLLTIVLALTFYKPDGLINFDNLDGKNLLIAQREGAANCMTTFKLKENNRFTERSVCFGMTEIKGNYKLINDTIYFEKVEIGRHENEFYKFAIIKPSRFNNDKKAFDLVRYKNFNDTTGNELLITINELYNKTEKKSKP